LPRFTGPNLVAQPDDLAHNKGAFKRGLIVDDDAVNMITSHADDEISFGNVFALDAATFVCRKVEAATGECLDGVVGCGSSPTKGSGRMHTCFHAAKCEVMRKEAHRHWRPTGITGADDQDFDFVILEGHSTMPITNHWAVHQKHSAMTNAAIRLQL
jgi:hypothetical protein